MTYAPPRLLSPINPPGIFTDERGSFAETWRAHNDDIPKMVCGLTSHSKINVLRGLHYQTFEPRALIVRCAYGCIIDVSVDLRKGSPTYGQGWRFTLTAPYPTLFIPAGFAHGFFATAMSVVVYDASQVFDPATTKALRANDPALKLGGTEKNLWRGILFPTSGPIMSAKDRDAPGLAETIPLEVN